MPCFFKEYLYQARRKTLSKALAFRSRFTVIYSLYQQFNVFPSQLLSVIGRTGLQVSRYVSREQIREKRTGIEETILSFTLLFKLAMRLNVFSLLL